MKAQSDRRELVTRDSRALLALIAFLMVFGGLERRAQAQTKATAYALIVTSNRSARLSRPDLRYADDDGAKYYEMFRMLAPESNVRLLTTFDADSEKLFPDLVSKAHPPTRAAVMAAAAELATAAATAKGSGPVDFYFVFAGHGDIQGGKGFLDLPDGAFTADDLEALLKSVPATHAHVILDSCNSFFVVNSRKPGGRHFITSEEATKSLSERLPNVGVFLSTSAEAEVFEWSELQSGVFSHAVRSGLAGAADVNHDGHVSYDELRAFVNVASKDVKNPVYRPQVFARGPSGDGKTSLLDLTQAQGTRVHLDDNRHRVTVRDGNELPWFDFHKEAGETATLVLPARVAAGASIDEHGANGKRRHALETPAPAEIALASLTPSNAPRDPRGGDELFKSLFARPFGALAFATEAAEEAAQPQLVLGVSSDERERMRLILGEAADSGRRRRLVGGSVGLALNLSVGALGSLALANGIRAKRPVGYVVGGGFIAWGTYASVRSIIEIAGPSFEERVHDDFVHATSSDPTSQVSYAIAERRLMSAAEHDRKQRTWQRWLGLGVFAGYGTVLSYSFVNHEDASPGLLAFATVSTALGGALFVESFFPSTTERMADLWKNDPSRLRSASPTGLTVRPSLGLGSLGLTGTW